MSWFEKKVDELTDQELQAKITALVERLVGVGAGYTDELDRYERLLAEIYKRNLKPNKWIKPKEEKP